jgi:hypothetical protein
MTKELQKITEIKSQINISGFNGSRSLLPNTIDEAYRIAQAFSRSDFIPKEYRDKPDNCFTAINLGMEIGLPPMRALQSIAVVNGRPTIYGDAQLALVRSSGLLEIFEENYEGQEGADNFAAICKLKRKSDIEITIEKFSISDAKKAGLWGKAGPWSTHPKRMLRYKARAFALRDKFADVLLGLTHSVEEMEGEQMINVTPSKTSNLHESIPNNFDDKFGKEKKQIDTEEVIKANIETNSDNYQSAYDFEEIKKSLMCAESLKVVNRIVKEANDFVGMDPSNVLELRRMVNGLRENLR